jgi:hypothetical protein
LLIDHVIGGTGTSADHATLRRDVRESGTRRSNNPDKAKIDAYGGRGARTARARRARRGRGGRGAGGAGGAG